MSNNYQVWLTDTDGYREYDLSAFASLEYGRKLNEVTWCQLEIDNPDIFPLLAVDRRIVILKSIGDGAPFLAGDTCWFLRKWKRSTKRGMSKITMWGASANYLLSGREILYAAGSAQAKKTAKKPDVILGEIVTENLGSGAVTGRNLSTWLAVPAIAGSGTNISKSFAWREVTKTMQEIVDLAAQNSQYLFYDITYDADTRLFTFQTYTGQRGTDRTSGSANPVIFSADRNLDNIEEMFDYSNEVTAAIGLGKGEEAQRATNEQTDAVRIALSPFGRREKAKDATSADTPTALADEAKGLLREGLPVKNFGATLLDIGYTFDLDYFWGDRVTLVNAEGEAHHCFVDSYTIRLSQGNEDIKTTTKEIQ